MEPINRIAQARKDAHLTVNKLAELLNVDPSTLHNWETGRRQLTLDRLIQMSQVLKVSVTYLLGLDEQISYLEPVTKTMLPILHRMPVWTRSFGWALVNAVNQSLTLLIKARSRLRRCRRIFIWFRYLSLSACAAPVSLYPLRVFYQAKEFGWNRSAPTRTWPRSFGVGIGLVNDALLRMNSETAFI